MIFPSAVGKTKTRHQNKALKESGNNFLWEITLGSVCHIPSVKIKHSQHNVVFVVIIAHCHVIQFFQRSSVILTH